MKGVFIIALVSFATAYAVYVCAHLHYCGLIDIRHPYCADFDDFIKFYGDKLRGSLFAGFLTLGGFLLSLKTFIVVNMKKEVFESPIYKKEWDEQKKLDTDNKMGKRYTPLRYLSGVLYAAILSCLSTAVLQLTVGLVDSFLAVLVCLWAVSVSLLLLAWALWLIRANLVRMFDYLDSQDSDDNKNGQNNPKT